MMRETQWRAGLLLSLSLQIMGCSKHPSSDAPPPAPGEAVQYLSPTRYLVRVSMALRGTRPSTQDIEDVNSDPKAIDRIVDGYLETDAFGAMLRDMHNEALLVRAETQILGGFLPVDKLAGREINEIDRSVLEAPLRLIEHVVRTHRPYTEIVTADYTMADGIVATVWGMTHDGDDKEWKVAYWSDDRPLAGILSDPVLFVRHKSNGSNFNRGRANMVSKALLCSDFANRDIIFDSSVDLSDPDSVKNATTKNTACNGCHQTLDPLGSFFSGYAGFVVIPRLLQDQPFYPIRDPRSVADPSANALYSPAAEQDWKTTTGRAPGYFGVPGDRLDDLGRLIAVDPRFSLCAVKRFYAHLHQVEVSAVPREVASDLQRHFIESGFDAKALVRGLVLSDDFRALEGPGGAGGYKRATPEQLSRMVADLTGFTWEAKDPRFGRGMTDLTTDATSGMAILAGGIDSYTTVKPSRSTNATTSLFLERFAAETAGFVVDADFALPAAQRKLFGSVADGAFDEASVKEQLRALHLRLYGDVLDANDPQVGETYALFTHALDRAGGSAPDVRRAWKTTLSGMLADPSLLFY